jgi:uncharacterized RDD family membrane protein YckC
MENDAAPEECGVGIRSVAIAIDSVVWFALFFWSGFLVAAFTGELQISGGAINADLEGTPALVSLILWFVLSLGYHTLLEWRFGRTIGKSLVKIRATSADGAPLSLRSSLVRNVLRLIDFLPFFYLVGIVSLILSDRYERLGDRLANTVVVR